MILSYLGRLLPSFWECQSWELPHLKTRGNTANVPCSVQYLRVESPFWIRIVFYGHGSSALVFAQTWISWVLQQGDFAIQLPDSRYYGRLPFLHASSSSGTFKRCFHILNVSSFNVSLCLPTPPPTWAADAVIMFSR